MWTVQEVALGAKAQIISPKRSMDYDVFMSSLINWILIHSLYREDGSLRLEQGPEFTTLISRMEIRTLVRLKRKQLLRTVWPSASSLCRITAAQASIPSDKIFAVYGIMKELGVTLPSPDYKTYLGDIYWKACVAVMKHQNSLEPLELAIGSNWNPRTPSWVPDFQQRHFRYRNYPHFASKNDPGYQPVIDMSKDYRFLSTKAKIVDSVRGRIYWHADQEIESHNMRVRLDNGSRTIREYTAAAHGFQSYVRAISKLKTRPALYESHLVALLAVVFQASIQFPIHPKEDLTRRTRLFELIEMADTSPHQLRASFESIKCNPSFQRGFGKDPNFNNLAYLPEVQLIGVIEEEGLLNDYVELCKISKGNAFFWTDRNYLGSAPQCVREGDIVAMIPGVRAPMILRSSNSGRYHVIGIAYVYGLMNFNGWSDLTDIILE